MSSLSATTCASDLEWTIVYPVTLSNEEATNKVVATSLEQTPKVSGMPKVTRADAAGFLLETAANGTDARKRVGLRPSQ